MISFAYFVGFAMVSVALAIVTKEPAWGFMCMGTSGILWAVFHWAAKWKM